VLGIPLTATALKASLYTCAALGIALILTIAGWILHAGNLREQVTEANLAQGGAEASLATCTGSNLEWQTNALGARNDLAQCQAQWKDEKQSAETAVAKAEAGAAAALAELELFRKRWGGRGATCGAALLAMEQACAAEIGSY
jgi:multidrug resistance efflux pump